MTVNHTASIALSGMHAAQAQMRAAAHNIANTDTPGFRRHLVHLEPQAGGGVAATIDKADSAARSIESDLVAQLQAKQSYLANLAVFKTGNRMAGLLLDEKA